MRNLAEQRKKYDENWERNIPLLGRAVMPIDPLPLYWIGLKPKKAHGDIASRALEQKLDGERIHRWLKPEEMHVTLALPGRPGELEMETMLRQLREICSAMAPFTIHLGRLNCFPHVIFQELYSEDEAVFRLHEAIADAIPSSLEPQYRYENFLPHLSLCYLQRNDEDLRQALTRMRDCDETAMKIQSLVLMEANDLSDMKERPVAEIVLAG